MCLSFEENVPRTNNLLENLNGQIEQRLKTFRGVKSEDSLNKILKNTLLFTQIQMTASSFGNSATLGLKLHHFSNNNIKFSA